MRVLGRGWLVCAAVLGACVVPSTYRVRDGSPDAVGDAFDGGDAADATEETPAPDADAALDAVDELAPSTDGGDAFPETTTDALDARPDAGPADAVDVDVPPITVTIPATELDLPVPSDTASTTLTVRIDRNGAPATDVELQPRDAPAGVRFFIGATRLEANAFDIPIDETEAMVRVTTDESTPVGMRTFTLEAVSNGVVAGEVRVAVNLRARPGKLTEEFVGNEARAAVPSRRDTNGRQSVEGVVAFSDGSTLAAGTDREATPSGLFYAWTPEGVPATIAGSSIAGRRVVDWTPRSSTPRTAIRALLLANPGGDEAAMAFGTALASPTATGVSAAVSLRNKTGGPLVPGDPLGEVRFIPQVAGFPNNRMVNAARHDTAAGSGYLALISATRGSGTTEVRTYHLARIRSDASLDTTFGTAGLLAINALDVRVWSDVTFSAVAVNPLTGRILLTFGGTFGGEIAAGFVALTAEGSVDESFRGSWRFGRDLNVRVTPDDVMQPGVAFIRAEAGSMRVPTTLVDLAWVSTTSSFYAVGTIDVGRPFGVLLRVSGVGRDIDSTFFPSSSGRMSLPLVQCGGTMPTSGLTAIAPRQRDRGFVVVGQCTSSTSPLLSTSAAMLGYGPAGVVDPDFYLAGNTLQERDPEGVSRDSSYQALAIASDGRLVAVGTTQPFIIPTPSMREPPADQTHTFMLRFNLDELTTLR